MKKTLILALAAVVAFTLALSTGCKKKSPMETMMNYTVEIVKILKDNIANCEKAVTNLSAFVDKNKASIEKAQKALNESDAKQPSEEETKATTAKAKELSVSMTEFADKCPEKMQKINEILATLFTPTP